MVTADNHAGAAVILAEGCMQQAFSRTGIAHVQGITALNNIGFYKVVLHQDVNTFYTNICRNITGFQVADQGVNIDTVANFNGNLAEVFV